MCEVVESQYYMTRVKTGVVVQSEIRSASLIRKVSVWKVNESGKKLLLFHIKASVCFYKKLFCPKLPQSTTSHYGYKNIFFFHEAVMLMV